VAITGKLCRNPFSTIKLPYEDGATKADLTCVPALLLCEHSIFVVPIADLLMHGRTLCIQKALEKSVIRVSRRESVARP
jgi:hypothetical protein